MNMKRHEASKFTWKNAHTHAYNSSYMINALTADDGRRFGGGEKTME